MNIFLKEVTPDEICQLIQKLDIKKANDIYGIPPNLIKLSPEFIKLPLALIINDSFKERIFPAKLKVSMVHPIQKDEFKMQCSSYQPTSILPIFSKIVEKVMLKRIMQNA